MEIILPNTDFKCATLIDLLHYRAKQNPKKQIYTFLTDGEQVKDTITYFELEMRAKLIAQKLHEHKIKPGMKAILLYPPGLELIEAFFGCLYAGVIAVPCYPPINIRYIEKLAAVINNCKPDIIIATDEIIKGLNKIETLQFISKIPLLNRMIKQAAAFKGSREKLNISSIPKICIAKTTISHANDSENIQISDSQVALLQYTSGSTGTPKGVILTHQNLIHNLSVQCKGFEFDADDVMVSWLPPYHDMGLIGSILQPMFIDIPGYYISPYHFLQKPFRWLQLISNVKGTVSGGPNFAYDYCTKKITSEQKKLLDLSSWKVAFNGAEPIRLLTMDKFYQAFKECGLKEKSLYPCYGLAEATLFVSSGKRGHDPNICYLNSEELRKNKIVFADSKDLKANAIVSCGIPWHKIAIIDVETNQLCKEEQIGEVWISSNSVAKGYYNNPDVTKEAFQATIPNEHHHTEYLRTGDLGFMYKGELYIAGRLKDIINIRGVNHFPQDIEYTAGESHPLINNGSCAAFTILLNDEDALVIVCEIKSAQSIDKESLSSICDAIYNSVLLHQEIRTSIIYLVRGKSLQKTSSGKIRRRIIKKNVEDNEIEYIHKWEKLK